MYAAGIAVMFLLFSATGAGGSLLEEHEAGTLDRLLSSQLSITQLLAGKWLYIVFLGCVQLTLMFVWADIVFGVDLRGHILGFAVLTFCTATATASRLLPFTRPTKRHIDHPDSDYVGPWWKHGSSIYHE